MPFRVSVVPVALASLVLAGCGDKESAQQPPNAPPAEHPLLGAPDPAKPTERGVFIKDRGSGRAHRGRRSPRYWETTDDETELTYSLDQVVLPRDIERYPARNTPTTTDPIAPNTADACDIVATDSALYELGNPRCSSFPGRGTGGEIRRLVSPRFRPADD